MQVTSQHAPTAASSNQILPAGYDGGNGSVKLVVDDAEIRIPSYFHLLREHELLEIPDSDQGSLIEYLSGDRPDLIGQRWLTGAPAYQHSPQGHQRVVDDKRGKLKFGLQMLLGALGTLPNNTDWNLFLTASIQDAQAFGGQLTETLKGQHTVLINGNLISRVTLNISAVQEEGVGAIITATVAGLVPPNSQVILLDIGHGTVISSVFGPKGKLLFRDVKRGGVDALVDAIARNLDTRRQLLDTGDRAIIRAGIERGDFEYGHSGWNFRSVYSLELAPWCQQILAPALKAIAPWRATSESIIAIGGGAQLPAISQLLAKQQISVVSDGTWANARGLLKLSQLKMRKGV